MRTFDRRSFLKGTAGLMTSAAAMPYIIPSSVLGRGGATAPSGRLTMGAVGIGGQGAEGKQVRRDRGLGKR